MTWTIADVDQTIPERFEQLARRDPSKVAIGGTAWQPSFAELDAAANRLGNEVSRRRGSSGRVALLMSHDAPLFAGMLGVLKAGKTVVALNATDPPARLEAIRADTGAELVLADGRHRDLALRAGFSPGEVVAVAERPAGDSSPPPAAPTVPDEIAFLIYTSGSTGRPKGVVQTHRNMLHNALRLTRGLSVRSDDRLALLASVNGGQGAATTWLALLNGATLCPFPLMERGVTGLREWLQDGEITVLTTSASVFRHFARTLDGERLGGIRLLRLGSEPALLPDFEAYRRHFGEGCAFANTFSSSETGNLTRWLAGDDEPGEGRLPVGRPAEGIELLQLDQSGEEVPPGRVGEIVVRSAYLSPGYWRNEALTAERFIEGGANGEGRLYRTGDLGRLSEDGVLTVVGRADTQVKVRGNRVELSEVETALATRPAVAAAAVCASPTPRGDTRLTAYVTARPGHEPAAATLRGELRETLPGHSVPSGFVFLDELPMKPNGGIDRERLARIQPATPVPDAEPRSDTEGIVARIWADVLELDRVGPDVDFFDLGGDSLSAAAIAAEVSDKLGVELDLAALMETPTVATMARGVEELRRSQPDDDARPPLSRAPRTHPLPLSFDEERTWRNCPTPERSIAHNVCRAHDIRGRLDVAALRKSIDHIVRRHEILRTTYAERDGGLSRIVHPAAPFGLPLVDLTDAPDPRSAAAEMLRREARVPFDLERGPLLRMWLCRTGPEEHRLLRVNHHIISDARSWMIFFDELGVLYEAYQRAERPPLPDDLPLQYGDFAAWERGCYAPSSRRHREQVAWWRGMLQDAPSTPAPLPRPSTDDVVPSDCTIDWGLEPEVSGALDRLGEEAGATFYMTRLALFAATLANRTGQYELAFVTFMSRRRRPELQGMFGYMVDWTILRLRVERRRTFREWLDTVREAVLETRAHMEIPFRKLLEEVREQGVTPPVVEATFAETYEMPPLRVAGIEINQVDYASEAWTPGFKFRPLQMRESDGGMVVFDARRYDPDGVRSFIETYQGLAASVAGNPDRRVGAQMRSARRSRTSLLSRLSLGRIG